VTEVKLLEPWERQLNLRDVVVARVDLAETHEPLKGVNAAQKVFVDGGNLETLGDLSIAVRHEVDIVQLLLREVRLEQGRTLEASGHLFK